MILYSIRRGPRGYMLAKFDDDFSVAAVYNVNTTSCDCPAGVRPSCKHRKMLPRMLAKVDTGEFYCYETQSWHQPLGDLERPQAGDLEGREAMPDIEAEGRQGVVQVPSLPSTPPPPVASAPSAQPAQEGEGVPMLPPLPSGGGMILRRR